MRTTNIQMGLPSLEDNTTVSADVRPTLASQAVARPRVSRASVESPQVMLPLAEMFDQYVLSEEDAAGYGNLVAIYDLLPRFYGWQKKVTSDAGFCTDFYGDMRGKRYHVRMTAAAIQKRVRATKVKAKSTETEIEEAAEIIPLRRPATETVFMYPGMREELVEDALRKFSVSGNGFVDGSQLRVKFTIRDLMQELAKNNHTFSCNEVKEALEILNRAHLSIKIQTDSGVIEESSTYLPHLSFAHKRKVVDGNDVCIAQLHPLIVGGIRTNNVRLYGYNHAMAVSSSLARYLLKYLSVNWLNASPEHPYNLGLVEIMSATSRGLQPRMHDNTRFMEKAIQELIDNGVLTRFEKKTIQATKSKKILDAHYKVFPTNGFVTIIIKGHNRIKSGNAKAQRASLIRQHGSNRGQ